MESHGKIGMRSLVAYGLGDLYGGGSFLVISTLFLFFLTDVIGLTPALAGLVVFGGKAWDALSDPLMGCISDRTRSRHGRRRVYFLAGIVPIFVSFVLLWVSVRTGSRIVNFLYYFFAYALFCTVFTMVMIPYSTLPTEMTTDYRERTRLSGSRMIFSQLSSIVSGTLPGLFVHYLYKDDTAKGFLLVGIFFGLFYALPWILVFRGTWEMPESERRMPSAGLAQSFKDLGTLLGVRSFRIHIGLYLLGYSAVDVLSALFVYYLTYYVGAKGAYTACLGSMLIAQLVALPAYLFAANRLGKGKTYALGGAVAVVVSSAFFGLRPGASLAVLIALSAGLGVGLSAVVAMPWAMLPESADADELANGLQRAGAVSGTFTLVRKLVQALVLWLVGILLSAIGYRADSVQTAGALMGIRGLFCFGPLALVALGSVLAFAYPITPAVNAVMRAELDRVKAGERPSETGEAAAVVARILGRKTGRSRGPIR